MRCSLFVQYEKTLVLVPHALGIDVRLAAARHPFKEHDGHEGADGQGQECLDDVRKDGLHDFFSVRPIALTSRKDMESLVSPSQLAKNSGIQDRDSMIKL